MKCTIYYSQNDTPLLCFSVYNFHVPLMIVMWSLHQMTCDVLVWSIFPNLPVIIMPSIPGSTVHQLALCTFELSFDLLFAKLTIYANFQYTSIKVDGRPDSQPQCGLLYAVCLLEVGWEEMC